MQPRWRLTALSLSLAFSPASAAAQTHYVTGAPTVVSAGAFATTVVFEGGEIFVGRPGEFAFFPIPANHAGTVHVFGLDDMGNWEETAVLSSESVEVGDGFGMSLAVDGNTLLAGAPKTRGGRGAVYVFTRSDADAPWRAVTTLRSGTRREGDEFGAAVAIDGEFALIGSPGRMRNTGAVVVFRLLAGAWTEVATVEGSATSPDERFGSALAVDGNRLLVGAPGPFPGIPPGNPSPRRAGSAYVFHLEGGRFVESAQLTSGQDEPGLFGYAVVLSEKEAFLGAPLGNENSGVVHHFVIDGSGRWNQGAQITAATAAPGSGFGMSVSYAAGDLWVGAPLGGGAYVLRRSAGEEWQEVQILTISAANSFAYAVGSSAGGETCGGGLHIIDIREPASPTFAGCFSDPSTGRSGTGYSHDAQCVIYAGPDEEYRGREICFGANETALSIADVTDKSNPVAVASATYPNPSYVHQGWISEDHRFFFVNDEGDELDGTVTGTRTLVWDIEDLEDPILAKEHIGETEASDHNLYVRGQFMYQSNYVSGLRILDISDPVNPHEVGYFDSVPVGDNSPGFAGSWSNYPFFESGVIVFTSMREGLFVVRRGRQPVL